VHIDGASLEKILMLGIPYFDGGLNTPCSDSTALVEVKMRGLRSLVRFKPIRPPCLDGDPAGVTV
jgi:hypothetical protein